MALKRNRRRWDDALSRMDPTRFEALIGDHYRKQGYEVEHVGAQAIGHRYDGGIDLKMHRGGEYLIVQCKRWTARKVPHNDVHELLGIMLTEGASGAMVVTSGEFTLAARNAAAKYRHVQLIDGIELRAILGPRALADVQAALATVSRGANLLRRGRANWRSIATVWSGGMWVGRIAALVLTVAILAGLLHVLAGSAQVAGRSQAVVSSGFPGAVETSVDNVISSVRRSARIADPRRRIDREAARAAVRPIGGVRSVIWLDRTNLIVMVDGARYRTTAMIDTVCSALSPLGDTLAVVVNLQDVTATKPDGATTLSRNCALAQDQRALFQPQREIDVTSRQLRETFKGMQEKSGSPD